MKGEIVGSLAACLTTAAFVPQVVQVWRTKSVKDISLGMYTVFCLGVTLWIAYGVGIRSRPVVLANSATLLLALAVLVAKLRYGALKGR